MAQETINRPGAITAGTPSTRSFRTLFPDAQYPYRLAFRIYNRSSVSLRYIPNGDAGREVRVSAGDAVTIDNGEETYFYSLEPVSGSTTGGDVDVFEYGGIDEA